MNNIDIKGALEIMNEEYPKVGFIIENLIVSKGLTLFAGSPKIGKSWFVLQMLLSVSYDRDEFIGHKINEHGSTLYLSLEDTESRIQERIKKQGFTPDDNKLKFAFKWTTNEEGVKDLSVYLKDNPNTKIICIDTKGKFSEGREDESFQKDYSWMSKLKQLADKFNVSVILITHLRKRKAEEDPYESISGSSANTAAADTVMMLKRARNTVVGKLCLTSRDFQETEESITFEQATCTWHKTTQTENTIPYLTQERAKIIDVMKKLNKACTAKDIASITNDEPKNVSNKLLTMKERGLVTNVNRGVWVLTEQDEMEDTNDEEYIY